MKYYNILCVALCFCIFVCLFVFVLFLCFVLGVFVCCSFVCFLFCFLSLYPMFCLRAANCCYDTFFFTAVCHRFTYQSGTFQIDPKEKITILVGLSLSE